MQTAAIGPQETVVSTRWPDGVRCPRCGAEASERPAVRARRRWRCRGCRFEFTATAGTCLHGSKIPLAAWVAAALAGDMDAAATPAARRRVRETVESTGLPPGDSRLRSLLTGPGGVSEPAPLDGVTPAGRTILACLRGRLTGATAKRIADDCGLSPSHTRRSLRQMQSQGFAEHHDTSVMWGYRSKQVRLWRLAINERTLAALPLVGWRPPTQPPATGTVPPEFWYLFWSGQDASKLTVADDAVHIADTLVGGFDRAARCWALNRLPIEALRTLRSMRGYRAGRVAALIDSAIKRRSAGE
ncbi:MAG: transposase [Acidimicrobiaceae bacterium]|nr:transposase [Acidimicrobiaceae bacterium]